MVFHVFGRNLVEQFSCTRDFCFLNRLQVQTLHCTLCFGNEENVLNRTLVKGNRPVGRIVAHRSTETCIFYDGKAHKFGAVDVETFPKDDKYMEPWKFISEDGRFNMTMKPTFDYHTDLNLKVGRMHAHQVHGIWSGDVTLDDGTKLEIKDMYAFCEYVENTW